MDSCRLGNLVLLQPSAESGHIVLINELNVYRQHPGRVKIYGRHAERHAEFVTAIKAVIKHREIWFAQQFQCESPVVAVRSKVAFHLCSLAVFPKFYLEGLAP